MAAWLAASPQALGQEDPFQMLIRPTEPLSAEEEQRQLEVPAGFAISLYAAEPQINKPTNLALDERGRVWVSSTVEYPHAAPPERWLDPSGSQVRDSRDAIKILSDTNDDGRADRVVTFVEGLNIPIGVLPYGRGCIAWSIPNIWYLEDTDGDDRCDRRTVLFGPLGWERDTHGNIASMRLEPDGWVYATHGFNNISKFEVLPDRLAGRQPGDPGTRLEVQSGHVFRFRPDGSAVELWTRGQVNPFGMAFDPWGQMFTADCHSDPVTHLIRGSCYPSFGKPHDGLGFGPVTCPHRHKSTGLCGLAYVSGGIWGEAWNDRVLIGNCVTSRVNLDQLTYVGSTPKAVEQPDFVVSRDPWFRPVDLRLGADGALYVADFYNRIIGHYEVDRNHPGRDRTRGRIWRIAKTDGPNRPATTDAASPDLEQTALWRWQKPEQLAWADADFQAAWDILNSSQRDARLRRTVLEALSVRRERPQVAELMAWSSKIPAADASLRHTWRIALRNHLLLPHAVASLSTEVPSAEQNELLAVLRAVDRVEVTEWLWRWLQQQQSTSAGLPATIETLAQRLPAVRQAELVALVRSQLSVGAGQSLTHTLALRTGQERQGLRAAPELTSWAESIAEQILTRNATSTPSPASSIIDLAALGQLHESELNSLVNLATSFRLPRIAAAIAERLAADPLVSKSLDRPGPTAAPLSEDNRLAMATCLARYPEHLAPAMALLKVSPTRLQVRLAEALAGSLPGGRQLLDAAPPRVLALPAVQQKLNALGDKQLSQTLQQRTAGLKPSSKELEQLVARRSADFVQSRQAGRPDAALGQQIFVKSCGNCHQVAGQGKQVGPALDGMKARGPERLCEDILDPNRAVDPAFRTLVVALDDGTIVTGLLRREDAQVLVLADQNGQERTLPVTAVDERSLSGLSLMPTNFAEILSPADFEHLLAFLLGK